MAVERVSDMNSTKEARINQEAERVREERRVEMDLEHQREREVRQRQEAQIEREKAQREEQRVAKRRRNIDIVA